MAESPSPGEAEATLAAGGDLNADDGQPVDSPPQHTAFDIPSDDAAAASSPTPTPESPTPNVTATDSIPMADAPLQVCEASSLQPLLTVHSSHANAAACVPSKACCALNTRSSYVQFYSGSLASGRCKYSHFNGMRCKKGGRLADTRTHPEAEGGICWMKVHTAHAACQAHTWGCSRGCVRAGSAGHIRAVLARFRSLSRCALANPGFRLDCPWLNMHCHSFHRTGQSSQIWWRAQPRGPIVAWLTAQRA